MTLSSTAIHFLEKYNRDHPTYVNTYFRLFYVQEGKETVCTFAINRNTHTVSEANKIAQKLKDLVYGTSHSLAYNMDIVHQAIQPALYTKDNSNLVDEPILYIM